MSAINSEHLTKLLEQNQQMIGMMQTFFLPVNVPERKIITKDYVYREMLRFRTKQLKKQKHGPENC